MITDINDLYFRFADRTEALLLAELLKAMDGEAKEQSLPPDGWVDDNYYNLVDVGTVYKQTGTNVDGSPIMTADPGYHVIMRWRGPDPVHPKLLAFEVDPWAQTLGEVNEPKKFTYTKDQAVRLAKAGIRKQDLVKEDLKDVIEDVKESIELEPVKDLPVEIIKKT